MSEYISREAFLSDKKWLYCTDCEKRKGKKRGKMVTLYEIGEAPCKSCGIHDMLEEVEAYPAADVRPVVLCRDCKNNYNTCLNHGINEPMCDFTDLKLREDDFCSRGEKREES